MENDFNCAQECARRIFDMAGVGCDKRDMDRLSLMGDGLGCGSVCGAIIGAFYVLGKVFEGEKSEELRYEMIVDFVDRFKYIDCTRLERHFDNDCRDIKERVCFKAYELIKNRTK